MNINKLLQTYENRLHSEDDEIVNEAIFELLQTIDAEGHKELSNGMSFHNVIAKYNDIWNALVELDIQKYGQSNLRFNGYTLFWEMALFKHVSGK